MNSQPLSNGKIKKIRFVLFAAAMGVALCASLFFSCGKKSDQENMQGKEKSAETVSSAETRRTLEKLVGQWRRPDGGYILVIRSVQTNGNLDAGYYNPRPINVSKAKASVKAERVEVFIELYDEGYPGSTYTLIYESQGEALVGTYYQAAAGQTFDVFFVKAK